MKLDEIEEAKQDTVHHVSIPFANGKTLEIDYLPLTEEVLYTRSAARQLSAVIKSWNVEEEHTFEVLVKRPVSFLQHIADAIVGDYLPKKES